MRHNVSHASLLIIRLSVLVAYALINISNNEQNIKVEKFMNQQPTQNIANIQSIQQVLDLKPKIPDYQRPYKWQKHHVSQLFNDLLLHFEQGKQYRIGTVVFHQHDNNHVKKNDIVDGQQRLITLSLLLNALGVKSSSLLNEKLQHSVSQNNIVQNHRFIQSLLKDNVQIDKNKFTQYILGEDGEAGCEMVCVKLDNLDQAFQFFDTQNARGKPLEAYDLLKAYHLREMIGIEENEVERIVKGWEQISQSGLADFFGNYLYRIKEWVNGNRAEVLDERNIHMFKGITRSARTPYAQFYKSAYCYADMVNSSAMPFVSGTRNINAFQLDAPIIAGKPFFEYTKHYYAILKDIQDNSKYEGFYINDNIIVKTLDRYFKKGVGNGIARLLFDTSVLLYVDRFCPESYPTKEDMELFEQFVVYAFVWAYSLRAQYTNLGWLSAQNFIMETNENLKNSFNMYKLIARQDTPTTLLSVLADKLTPLSYSDLKDGKKNGRTNAENLDEHDGDGVYLNYLYFFKVNRFYK